MSDGREGGGPSPGSRDEALSAAVDALTAAGVESPRLDAELMLCQAAAISREELAADPDALLDAGAGRELGQWVRRRLRREPLAYILGRKAFRYLELITDRRALVPRPETELLVDVALGEGARHILEIGTGSGAVSVAIASEAPGTEVVATDVSTAALELARENAIRIGVADRIRFEPGTLPQEGSFDLVVANLPYVPDPDWEALEPEITRHEPREALAGGVDGLEVIREVVGALAASSSVEAPALALEVGDGQSGAVAEILAEAGWGETEARRDLAGTERVIVGRRH